MTQILLILVFSIPLITWQGNFEAPKVFMFLIFSFVLLLNLILNLSQIKLNKVDKYYFYWILSLLISGFLNEDIRTIIVGGSYRHQGLIFFISIWLLMKTIQILNKVEKNKLYKTVAVIVLVEVATVFYGNRVGTIGDVNAVSGYLAMGSFFVFTFLPKWLVSLPILAMFISFSKSGFLSLTPYIYRKNNIFFILALVIMLFVIKPINNFSIFENRQVIWSHAIKLIFERPIIGYGLESNEKLFKESFDISGFPLSGLIIDRAHNLILDISIWSGLVGMLFFSLFMIEKYKNLNKEMRGVFLSFVVFSMFQPLSIVHWIMFALIV